jgi:hypothetical protein
MRFFKIPRPLRPSPYLKGLPLSSSPKGGSCDLVNISERALSLGAPEGLVKVVGDEETDLLLGVFIVGPQAGELTAEATLALEMGATLTDLALTVHAHPTLSEGLMEAAEAFHKGHPHPEPPITQKPPGPPSSGKGSPGGFPSGKLGRACLGDPRRRPTGPGRRPGSLANLSPLYASRPGR